MILTKAQAAAVYTAMVVMNNVGARVKTFFGDMDKLAINVFEDEEGFVKVVRIKKFSQSGSEFYENQTAFAEAYKLI